MAKRSATTELNHDNWDKEEEPEEAGVFQKASSDVLQTRVIRTAKRRAKLSDTDSKPSPFSGFSGFGNTSSNNPGVGSLFSFLSQNKNSSGNSGKDETKQENNISNSTKSTQSNFKNFTNPFTAQTKDTSNFSLGSTQKNTTTTDNTSTTFKPFEHIFKQSKPSNDSCDTDKKSQNLELLKDLNLSCSKWISEHLEKNPYCILTPIFKDYEKHLAQLELNTVVESKEEKTESQKSTTNNNSITETAKTFSSSKEESADSNVPQIEKDKEKEKTTEFKFGESQPIKPFWETMSSGTPAFGAPSPFSFNKIAAKPVTDADSESKKDDEESEEPPKNDFVPVVEEDSIFDIKCKVFVKKEGNFVSRGVGTLFLKPVKDSSKTQAVVRAHTNLGNILLNIILTPGMPIQKTGKNNAMIVCVPTPESKPPPVPVLIRVKTSEECDNLIKKLEECRGS